LSKYIYKLHNVSVLLYHFVCPAKYRKVIFNKEVDETLKLICLKIAKRYEINFLEIGIDKDHFHFLIQSVPKYSENQIIRIIKSTTAKKIFAKHPQVKEQLWGGEFWSDGFFFNTASRFGSEATITKYVRDQGIEKDYKKLYDQQINFF